MFVSINQIKDNMVVGGFYSTQMQDTEADQKTKNWLMQKLQNAKGDTNLEMQLKYS